MGSEEMAGRRGARRGNGDGDGDDREHEEASSEASRTSGSEESFADLLGDAKPLATGKQRLPPVTGSDPRTRPKASHSHTPASFRYPDPGDQHSAAADGVTDAQLATLARGQPEPEERIDLHGTRRDAAGRLLAKRLEAACARGLRCAIVIHGRGQNSAGGEAVLRNALPGWLTGPNCARHVLAFSPAPDRLGGSGATLVLLRGR